MGKENYNDQYNDMYKGYGDDYSDANNFYQNNGNYAFGNNQNNLEYDQNQWSVYNQQGYNNYQYDYYPDDNIGYIYDDQYSIDYSNSSSDFNGYDYGYNAGDDISLFDLSSKINANCEQDLFFDRANQNYDNNMYGNYTMPVMNEDNYQGSYDGYDNNSMYGGVDANSSYFDRNGSYDNKIMPTQDIMFDDMYIVKNQLFEEEEKLFTFNDIISLAICAAFAIVMAFLINQYAGQVTTVDGHSMEYNFHDRDILILDKISYKLRKPKRYEVVVFPVKDGKDYKHYIKRIIGLPGEKVYVDVQNNAIYIDGKKLTKEKYAWENYKGPGLNVQVNNITLGNDEYYCMGDNRNNSQDSRASSVGPIKGEDFVGRAIFKIAPITSFGFINHDYNNDIRNGKRKAYKFDDK